MTDEKVMNRWIVVIGALLIQLALGTIYCWGNVTSYVTPWLNANSSAEITGDQTIYVFAVGLMAFAITMIFAGQLQQKIGPMKVALLGGVLVSVGVLSSSAATSLGAFIVTYGVIFGIGIGFAYVCPIACAAKWFPDKKGMINGIAVAGFGAGAFIFNKITTGFVNPDNLDPTVPEVYNKVPDLMLMLGGIYAAMILLGALTLKNPPAGWKPIGWNPPPVKDKDGKEKTEDELNFKREEAIKYPQFWMLWLMFILTAAAGLFTIGNYKAYGDVFSDDVFLSDVGAWAALFNGLGRVVWGSLTDKIGYKKSMFGMFGLQAVLMFTFSFADANRAMFFIWVCMIYFCFGGNFSLYPTATTDTFGPKYLGPNYGIIFTAYGIAGVSGALLKAQAREALGGFDGLFYVMGALSIGAIVVAYLLKPPEKKK